MTRITICSGEPSGDAMVQDLLPAVRARFGADLRLSVLTSSPIEGLGEDEVLCRAPEAVLGFSGALRWRTVLEEVCKALERNPPDLFVAVSHHGFNLIVAAEIKAIAGARTKTLMVAPPEVWAWDVRLWLRALRPFLLRVARRRQSVPYALGAMLDRGRSTLEAFDGIACLLEPNVKAYRRRLRDQGGDTVVTKVGHPFARYADSRELKRALEAGATLRTSLAPPAGHLVVGLFPGSREAEVACVLPIMLDAVTRLQATFETREHPGDGLEFFVAASGKGRAAQIRSMLDERSTAASANVIPVVVGQAEAALTAADFGLLCSGTVTLQAACLGLPSVVAYERGWSLAKTAIGHLLVRKGKLGPRRGAPPVPFALPSAVLGESVFPELAMSRCTPERVAAALVDLIEEGDARDRLRKHQGRLLGLLQPEPPTDGVGRVADTPMQRVAEFGYSLVAASNEI